MRRIIAALGAGSLLVGTAFTATALSGGVAAAQETEVTAETSDGPPRRGEVLELVLDDLVTQLTITEAQADAIAEAFDAKVEELRADHPEAFRRGAHRGFIRGLLEDGVISAEELASLPEDSPLTDPEGPAGPYLGDGQITEDEWQQLKEDLHPAAQEATDA